VRKRRAQVDDIELYCWFLRKCRKYPWVFDTPIRYLERLFWKNHRTLQRGRYYDTVMLRLGISPVHPLSYYRDELMADEFLKEAALQAMGTDREDATGSNVLNRENYVTNYYALIRENRPKIVIETGTAEGRLTSWVLSAMYKNNHGKLLSIDIPPQEGKLTMTTSLAREKVGCFIPERYRDRWEYHTGDAKKLLPKLLLENEVDIFIHDSLHTRTHMLFEYNCARALMRPGTIIISHDILWNKAFFCFTASHNLLGLSSISDPNLGLVVNTFDRFEEEAGLGVVEVD